MIQSLLDQLKLCGAPETLISELRVLPDTEERALLEVIDASPYGVEDWARALVFFDRWAREHSRSIGIHRMRDYLGCCIDGAKSQTGLVGLEDLLEHYLENHGVE
jgi:hypothetical protein